MIVHVEGLTTRIRQQSDFWGKPQKNPESDQIDKRETDKKDNRKEWSVVATKEPAAKKPAYFQRRRYTDYRKESTQEESDAIVFLLSMFLTGHAWRNGIRWEIQRPAECLVSFSQITASPSCLALRQFSAMRRLQRRMSVSSYLLLF